MIKLNIPLERNMCCNSIDEACAKIENIFKIAIKKFVPEIEICDNKVDLSSKSLSLIKEKKR